jgi:hypothetical protein
MTLYDFYMGLPNYDSAPLYIRGYTEVLASILSVRIITDVGLVNELDLYLKQMYFWQMQYPCFYIPILYKGDHYGFILKDNRKRNIKYSNWLQAFNLDAVDCPGKYVFMTEGIKDTYWFLLNGLPALAYLTNAVDFEIIKFVVSHGKIPVMVHDNDIAGIRGMNKFKRDCRKLKCTYFTFAVRWYKDSGDVFDYYLEIDKQLKVLISGLIR